MSCAPRLIALSLRSVLTAVGFAVPALGAQPDPPPPTFTNVTVHDPSIVRDNGTFYVFGSHLASASSTDLLHWTQLSTGPTVGNPIFSNPPVDLVDALNWVDPNTGHPLAGYWAPDVVRLGDGRYRFYYCIGRLDQPRAALGLAVSDSITGPYSNPGIMLRSGQGGQPAEEGSFYDPTIHPNTVDPAVFFDQAGRLWMVYGSYSGGIFILELDPATGMQLPGQGYGRHLIGGNHVRIEGPYIIYSPETDYYYLFMSFGGLDSTGGYNIRVGRSRNPDGPYFDAEGTDLATVKGPTGTLFDDAAIAPHGVKLMGGYQFLHTSGDAKSTSRGYLSPGHNSVYRDPDTGKYLLIFHTRFVGRGEEHEVRVHQMFLNTDGWFVVAPQRYAKETISATDSAQIPGDFKLINHGKTINSTAITSTLITLNPGGAVTGSVSGTWQLVGDYDATFTLGGVTYHGVFVRVWDDDNLTWVLGFTALSADGTAIWGSKVATAVPPVISGQPVVQTAVIGSEVTLSVIANGTGPLTYQWKRNGVDIIGATSATFTIASVSTASGGTYTVVVTGAAGTATSDAAVLTVDTTPRLINLSCRAFAGAGDDTLIMGFYISGAGGKTLLVRGIGPKLLDYKVPVVVSDPLIHVYKGNTIIDGNDDWDGSLAPEFAKVGAFELDPGSNDAALLITLQPGSYTVHLVNSGAVAEGLIEIYDLSRDLGTRLTNVSCRLRINAGENIILGTALIGGTVPVLARNVGPGIAEYLANPDDALGDPNLKVFLGQAQIDANDDWDTATGDYFGPVGAFSLTAGSKDSAIRVLLQPGGYTIHASGNNGTSGIAIIELYESP